MPAYSTLYSKSVDSDATIMTFGESVLLLVEKVYCFLIGAALFTIFFNYRSEAKHIGMPTFIAF